jgi:hypothetical protein
LWSLMVFYLSGFVFIHRSSVSNAASSAGFAFGIEVAKLYHTPWLDAFRCTTMGGLLLGHAFSWENILCYLVGITAGAISEQLWTKTSTRYF